MKKRFLFTMALAMILGTCSFFTSAEDQTELVSEQEETENVWEPHGYLNIDDEIEDLVFKTEKDQTIQLEQGETQADLLHIQYAGFRSGVERPDPEDSEAVEALYTETQEYAWNELLLNEFVIAAPQDGTNQFYFYYAGNNNDSENGDSTYVDYDSYYYDNLLGQVKRAYYNAENRYVAYVEFEFPHSGLHNGVCVEYMPELDVWKVDRFDYDTVNTPEEAVIAARFYYLDSCGGFEVNTESSNLNVRATPGGEKIASLPKGTKVTVYRCELPAEDGRMFTLIAKYTEPDEEGIMRLEYYGWCATEYLGKIEDYLWTLYSEAPDEQWINDYILNPIEE